jgi:hypothetical protein
VGLARRLFERRTYLVLTKYEKLLNDYRAWYPNFYNRTVECRPSGRYSILVTLDDDTRMEYNSLDNTIRDVTRLYLHNPIENMDEETWRKEFGQKLRRVISERGVNQETISDRLGISRQMLTRYVRGMSTPSGYNVSRLSELLDCDIRELTKFGYIDEE